VVITQARLRRAIERARFELNVHCDRCAATLERTLGSTDGVLFVSVYPWSGETIVVFDGEVLSREDIRAAIEAGGVVVRPVPALAG
jgi:copper chaperone CopZ